MATINQRPTGSFQLSVMLKGKRFRKDFRTKEDAETYLAEMDLDRPRNPTTTRYRMATAKHL